MKPILSPTWRKQLFEVLAQIGLIDGEFTGKIVVNFNQGNVTDVHKEECIK